MLKQWSDEYVLGIDEIDEQHLGFFAASHRLYHYILNCEGEKAVEDTVEFLRDYAKQHFTTEEAFMKKHEYPHLEHHKSLHIAFFEQLGFLVDDFKTFGASQHLADRTLEIAQDWLIDHIAEEDAQYAAHVRGRGY